ncbi:putative reverse transcriptase domain-containing protein [Tanacetum coccineum]
MLIAENDKLQQSYYEEVKEMQFSIREHFQWICNDHEMVNLKLQGQEKELELRSTELQKRENQLAIMEQKKAEERMLKLAEDQKREKEKLHDQIIELQKKLDDKQRLELEIRQMKGALKELEDLEALNQALIIKGLKSNDELVDAHKELISGLMENSARSLISVKRMGVLDVKPFIAAAKRNGSGKNETIKMASLWESHLMDPSWHPFKVITVDGKIKCSKDIAAMYFDMTDRILKDSTVTYTAVSSPFEDGSDIGSPGVDGPPIMPEDPYAYIMAAYQVPPSPDYIPGPEEPQSPPPLDFVPEPMYPEYIPQEDEILLAKEQPLPAAASPTADSPGYVPESDPEEEPEEDDEDPEEDPADYPADRDDDDDEDEDEDEEEEEEHPAPADSVPPVHRMTARISIRDEPSISLPPREEVERLLALTTPPPSPLTPLSSPLPHIPSPPFPASPPASVLPASPPLQLLSSDHRTDMPEITLPPRKRLGINLGPRYEIGESSAVAATRPIGGRRADYGFVGTMDTEIRRQRAEEVGYGIRDVWVDPREAVEEVTPMTLEGVNAREALVSREAWGRSIEVSYMTRSEIMALRSVVMGQQAVISQLQAADRRSQVVTSEMLQADHQRQVQLTKALKLLKGLQTQMVEF